MPGVAAVFTADDLRIPPQPPSGNVEGASGTLEGPFAREVLARETVRYVGEPVAVVIAGFAGARTGRGGGGLAGGRRARRRDRRGGGVRGRRSAALPGPRFEHRAFLRTALGCGRVGGSGRRRARTGRATTRWPRCPWRRTRSPWCPRTAAGTRSGVRRRCRSTSGATWPSCSRSTRSRSGSWRPTWAAGSARSCIVYPEFAVVAAAAKALGRPIRWAETRSESMLNLNHGRAQVQHVEIGAKRDGTRGRDARGAARRHGRLSGRRVPAHDHAGDARRASTRSP